VRRIFVAARQTFVNSTRLVRSPCVKADLLMPSPLLPAQVDETAADAPDWLDAFHRGGRSAMRQCYADHFTTVDRAVGKVLQGADKETVIHEVFFRLLTEPDLRATFRGGSLRAWIGAIARNAAIDYWRRRQHERPGGSAEDVLDNVADKARFDARVEARVMIERFREAIPPKWRDVFEARFVEQLDQSEAARALGIHRTTLVYQEFRVRKLLQKFVLPREIS
jgi:RNA polymerase sigma-70 factor (ECF subfamily)